jgi:hypothetical protein
LALAKDLALYGRTVVLDTPAGRNIPLSRAFDPLQRLRWGYLPGRPVGPNVNPPIQAEQRKPPHAPGNGV